MSQYQAIYDAVRSRISGCDIGQTVADAVREAFDISYLVPIIQHDVMRTSAEYARPSTVYRPRLSVDGDKWGALYGDDLQAGVVGFGDSPAEAMAAFDHAWCAKTPNVDAPARQPDPVIGRDCP